MNDIFTKGDPVTGLQIEPGFRKQLTSFNWWFIHATDALEFLRYLIFSDGNFGSGLVRLDVVKNMDAKGACTEPQHRLSEMAWANPERPPPDHPCGCVQYKTILCLLAAQSKPPSPEPRELKELVGMELGLRKHWQDANVGAAFLVLKEWPTGEENKAAELRFQDDVVLRFKFWRRSVENGGEVKGLRVEGRIGEML